MSGLAQDLRYALRQLCKSQGFIGGYYKLRDGTCIPVVGVAEDGKYGSLTEDPQPVMFLPILQSPSRESWLVVRSNRDPQQLGPAIRDAMRQLDRALPLYHPNVEPGAGPLVLWPAHCDENAGRWASWLR